MKTKTGEIPLFIPNKDVIACSMCMGRAHEQKCGCSEIAELEAALEVLARYAIDGHTHIGMTIDQVITRAKRQARRNLNRRKKRGEK